MVVQPVYSGGGKGENRFLKIWVANLPNGPEVFPLRLLPNPSNPANMAPDLHNSGIEPAPTGARFRLSKKGSGLPMAQSDGRIEFGLGYIPDHDAFALVVPGINMRVDLPQTGWQDFLNWLRGGWQSESFGSFEVVRSPRLSANVLQFTVNPQARAMHSLITVAEDSWDQMVTNMQRRGEELRRDYIEPFHQLLAEGVSKEAAIERLNRTNPNPFGMEILWRAPD